MLISYSFGNFRSFKDTATLNMKASSQTTFNENLIRTSNDRILPTAVIYGANASGKSNIISSLNTLRNIVIAGSVSRNIPNLFDLELLPFAHDIDNNPISFFIDFINENTHFNYELKLHVNKIRKGPRFICFEQLAIIKNKQKTILFTRNNNSVSIPSEKSTLKTLGINASFLSEISQNLIKNLSDEDLFLARGFKSIINMDMADMVIDFFANKVFVSNNFTQEGFGITIETEGKDNEDIVIWNSLIDAFVKGADFGPQQMLFKKQNNADNEDHTANMALYSIYNTGKDSAIIPSRLMESNGTLKLIDFAIAFQVFYNNGGLFIIDEFDAALHPEIVKGIIALFNNTRINRTGAQLVFTTHNPIYLNNRIFRRDQILFVEKDKDSYKSILYSLADFGSKDVRNDENYMINYFKGKYSSLPYIDFSSLIESSQE